MKNRITQRRRRGFSLLELLAVMAIMALLSTLAVTSYFGAIRGMARRSSVKHLANTLILARQRACMEGTRVSVMIYNEVIGYDSGNQPKLAPSYVVCKEMGRISYTSTGKKPALIDEFAALDKIFGVADLTGNMSDLGSTRLYNLTQGKWSNVYSAVTDPTPPNRLSAYEKAADGKPLTCLIPAFGFVVNKNAKNMNEAAWAVGDAYGLEVVPVNSLPRGFEFFKLKESLSEVVHITFKPDGSASEALSIVVAETQDPKFQSSVAVGEDGAITYDGVWK